MLLIIDRTTYFLDSCCKNNRNFYVSFGTNISDTNLILNVIMEINKITCDVLKFDIFKCIL